MDAPDLELEDDVLRRLVEEHAALTAWFYLLRKQHHDAALELPRPSTVDLGRALTDVAAEHPAVAAIARSPCSCVEDARRGRGRHGSRPGSLDRSACCRGSSPRRHDA
jgi:hypothetical protein